MPFDPICRAFFSEMSLDYDIEALLKGVWESGPIIDEQRMRNSKARRMLEH